MEIQDIKRNLTLSQILTSYGLKPKNNMLNCPFHEDKTASLQVNLEKHFYKCHACGAKGDQIQWVQDYEKITKGEAILKCIAMSPLAPEGGTPALVPKLETPPSGAGGLFLEKMFSSFRKGIFNSQPAKEYCKQRNLNLEKLSIGFNCGQFHHGTRRDETLINNCLAVGFPSWREHKYAQRLVRASRSYPQSKSNKKLQP
jgi:DNA primase